MKPDWWKSWLKELGRDYGLSRALLVLTAGALAFSASGIEIAQVTAHSDPGLIPYYWAPASTPVRSPALQELVVEDPMDAKKIATYITEAATTFDVSPELILAVIDSESSWKQRAKSKTGCRGLMQIGGKWKDYRKLIDKYGLANDPYDLRTNIFVGTYKLAEMTGYMRRKYFRTAQDRTKAVIASYNVGPRIVRKATKRTYKRFGRPVTWAEVYSRITPDLLATVKGYRVGRWHDGESGAFSRAAKTRNLRHFVRKVYKRYRANLEPS